MQNDINIVLFLQKLHLKKPYADAASSYNSRDIIFLKIIYKNKFYGIGSCSPRILKHELPENIILLLKKSLKPVFFDKPLSDWYYYHLKIQKKFEGFPSACHLIEEAFLNLFCHVNQISLTNLFGGFRRSCPIMYTISIMDIASATAIAQRKVCQGFESIKLKIGANLNSDIELINKMRRVLPNNIDLILDANEGYNFAQAKKLFHQINHLKINLIEQPVPRDQIEQLKKLRKYTPIPIVADEAVISTKDAFKLLFENYVGGVNIKLNKCGGPINFVKIFHLAKNLQKIIMLGCNHESQVSITTGAHLACALPIDFVDLDSGHMDFKNDPSRNGAIVGKGRIFPGKKISIKI